MRPEAHVLWCFDHMRLVDMFRSVFFFVWSKSARFASRGSINCEVAGEDQSRKSFVPMVTEARGVDGNSTGGDLRCEPWEQEEKMKVKLIVTADDLGIAPERDQGIFEAFEHGIVTSASLLVNGCTAREAGTRPAIFLRAICRHFSCLMISCFGNFSSARRSKKRIATRPAPQLDRGPTDSPCPACRFSCPSSGSVVAFRI